MTFRASRLAQKLSGNYLKVLGWLAALLLLYVFYLSGISKNPPGFYMDESGLAYNAYLIARTGASEFGVRWPLFFQFYTGGFTQYANPTHIYLLALFDLFFPPSILLARIFAATMVFIASLLLGYLATRISRKRAVGIIVALSAILTPWLFEIGRLVLEIFFYPLALVLFLIVLYRAQEKEKRALSDYLLLAITLALLTYSYTIGRLFAPLLAFGLIIFATNRRRLLDVIKTWALYAVMLIPLLIFNLRHPGLLTARFYLLTYIKPQMSWSDFVYQFTQRYLQDLSLISLLLVGDTNQRHHVPNALGSFLIATFILSAVGIIMVVVRHWRSAWWRYILYGLAVSIVPGALTVDQFHTLRLIAFPVFLLLLTTPALDWLLEEGQRAPKQEQKRKSKAPPEERETPLYLALSGASRRAVLIFLLAMTGVQAIYFQSRFRREGPNRGSVFDVGYKEIYDAAMAQPNRPIYLVDGYWGPAYIHAFWYATLDGRSLSEFVHLNYGQRPPAGALVISSEDKCTNCQIIEKRDQYMLYRAF